MCKVTLLIVGIVSLHILANFLAEARVTDEEYNSMPKLFHLDDYDSCMNLGKKALYCTITVQLSPVNANNHSVTWNIIQDVIADERNYRHDILRHGICASKVCPRIDVDSNETDFLRMQISLCYTAKYKAAGIKADVTKVYCERNGHHYPIDNFDVVVAIGFGILILVVVLSTFYEELAHCKSRKKYDQIMNTRMGRVIACFSLRRNWSRLRSDNANIQLKGLQGIRFYNTLLVIMAHVAMIAMAGPVKNPIFSENITRKNQNMIFINGYSATQTFMLITGFLISYNFLLVFERFNQFQLRQLIMAFVNRYIRLTPCLLVVMALNATWLYRFGNGPLWNNFMGTEYRNCRRNWWANLLYINNYYDVKHMCMQHTWYLATDMQLFVVALVVVAFMWKYQRRIKLILTISVAIGIAMPSIVNYYNNYDSVIRAYPEAFYGLFLQIPQFHNMYTSALPNFGAYALGLTFGYIFYSNRTKKLLTKKIHLVLWWLLVFGLPLGTIFYGILIYSDAYQYNRLGAAVYASLQKNLFALGLCFCVHGMTEGVGWFVRDCITWSPLQVLGRLTYCTFLVHTVVIRIRGGLTRYPTHLSYYTLFILTAGDAAVSYIFATLLALFVELPVSALQKLTIPQPANQRNSTSPDGSLQDNHTIKKKH